MWTTTLVENVLKELAVANGEAVKNGQQKFKFVGRNLSHPFFARVRQP